ncbi:MFS transporter [Aromatoleum toluvorans]|uniref:ADP,ATP carrier protein n=1 Tax=Aromatoleum toluvorans TaxID=92002 RepID=A0ABX1Q295_9RHOO|nr:Npt1/Npt2 family nucleotide transporter [Aromatoleum toluvorans]NMG45828.1 MFS transporter [Aromatoleum toluvorans]
MFAVLIRRVVPVRDGETLPLLLATAYGFAILYAYYLLRPVRDEIGAADRGNLQILWTAVFLVMLLAVPLYSAAVARWPRAVFVPLANRFFAAHLGAFYAALYLLPESARAWIDRVFYVWVSVFALFVVTVFWGFVTDLFHHEQGKRLFGFIAVGSSLGGIAGSATTAMLASHVPVFLLLLMAIVPLEAASWCARGLDRHAQRDAATLAREPEARIGGSAWSGVGLVLRSAVLRRIALWLLLMTFASTILYYVQAHMLGEAYTDRAARRVFLARVDLAVNVLTILTQVFLTALVVRRLGVGLTLALLPAVALVGFVALGAAPALAALVVVRVLYDSSRHALAKPAREVLFTLVSREERYKAKAFLDAAVYRGGDLASGWIYAGLAALGLSAGAIALAAVPVAGGWIVIARQLGRWEEHDRA